MAAATSPASSSQRAAGQDGSSAMLFEGPDKLRKATRAAASSSSSPWLQEPGFPDGSRSPLSQRCSPGLGPGLAALSRPAMAAAEPDSHQASPRVVSISRSEEHTSELQSRGHLVCRLLLEKKKKNNIP